jgi:hypothetical protein
MLTSRTQFPCPPTCSMSRAKRREWPISAIS